MSNNDIVQDLVSQINRHYQKLQPPDKTEVKDRILGILGQIDKGVRNQKPAHFVILSRDVYISRRIHALKISIIGGQPININFDGDQTGVGWDFMEYNELKEMEKKMPEILEHMLSQLVMIEEENNRMWMRQAEAFAAARDRNGGRNI